MNKIMIGVVSIIAFGLFIFGTSIKANYEISLDGQSYEKCLPFWVFAIKRDMPESIERGDLVKIVPSIDRNKKIIKDKPIAKIILGMQGDSIKIQNDQLFINEKYFGELHLIKALNKGKGSFDKEYVVPEGKYFVGGTSPGSYDSRYWGLIDHDEIKGKGNALF